MRRKEPDFALRRPSRSSISPSTPVSTHQTLIKDLATCRFVEEKVAVLIAGPCGTGKSHIAQALGHETVRHDHDVICTHRADSWDNCKPPEPPKPTKRRFQTLARVALLIIDDFGLKPLAPPQDETTSTNSFPNATNAPPPSSPATWLSRSGVRPFPTACPAPLPWTGCVTPPIVSSSTAIVTALQNPFDGQGNHTPERRQISQLNHPVRDPKIDPPNGSIWAIMGGSIRAITDIVEEPVNDPQGPA